MPETVLVPDRKRTTPEGKSSTVVSLELLRGLASLDVFFWHLLNMNSGFPRVPGLYRLIGWSRESVIVFFVLSGYVIALSQQRKHRGAGAFLQARVKRIVPLYLIALASAVVVAALLHLPCPPWRVAGHLLFLQSYEGSLVAPLDTNGPLWSLGTEFEFYALLAVILLLRVPALMWFWVAAALAAVVVRYTGYVSTGVEGLLLEFLGLSPCWLLGFLFAGLGSRFSLSLVQAITLFLMIPLVSYSDYGTVLPFDGAIDDLKCLFLALLIAPLVHTLAVRQLHPGAARIPFGWAIVGLAYLLLAGFSFIHPQPGFHPLPTIALLALPVVFFVVGHALPAETRWPFHTPQYRRVALFLGGSSYALYVIHTPLVFLAAAWISNQEARWMVELAGIAGAVVFLEFVVQPRAARLIARAWKPTVPDAKLHR